MGESTGSRRRSRAGLSTWKRHQEGMMGPWSYALLAVLLASFASVVLFFVGIAPLWVMAVSIPVMFVTYLIWNRKTDPVNNTWGEGARGEFRVGAELERLHEQGFHIFHDWDSGRGNVDHFVVGPQGIFAVETKAWNGKISAEDDTLVKNGWALRGRDDLLGQARGNAWKIHELVEASSGVHSWVVPVLCFTKAEVCCYGRVGGVEVTTVGTLTGVIADPDRPRLHRKGWEEYSPQEVKAISSLLEKKLGVGPAARPGLPPEEPTRTKKLLDRLFALPDSTVILAILGLAFLVSLALPERASKLFLGVAYLYQLLGQALG